MRAVVVLTERVVAVEKARPARKADVARIELIRRGVEKEDVLADVLPADDLHAGAAAGHRDSDIGRGNRGLVEPQYIRTRSKAHRLAVGQRAEVISRHE